MKKMLVCLAVIFFTVSAGLNGLSFCQEEETNYVYGEVVSVTGDSVTISEIAYDEADGEGAVREVTYTVAKDTQLENISSIDALEAGKEVDIEYTEKGGKKEISCIYVYAEE